MQNKSTLTGARKVVNIINTLEFLKSINDGKEHHLKNNDVFSAIDGKNDEVILVLKLKKQGLIDYIPSLGKVKIKSYWITEKGQQYIKNHDKGSKFKKLF